MNSQKPLIMGFSGSQFRSTGFVFTPYAPLTQMSLFPTFDMIAQPTRREYEAKIRYDNIVTFNYKGTLECPACYGRENKIQVMIEHKDLYLFPNISYFECPFCGEEFKIEAENGHIVILWLD